MLSLINENSKSCLKQIIIFRLPYINVYIVVALEVGNRKREEKMERQIDVAKKRRDNFGFYFSLN
jgi:hypothetical protein